MKSLDKAGSYDFPNGIEIDGIGLIHTLIKGGTQGRREFVGLISGEDELLIAIQADTEIHHHRRAFSHGLRQFW